MKHGNCRALQMRLPIQFEITHDPVSELVFSRCDPKKSFGKARLEAAHRVMRTSFEPPSVFLSFPSLHRFLFHSCTQDFSVAFALTHDAPFQRVRCDRSMSKGSD